mmetsp:Transcript_334/g.875  ORF Transcript_334/g.875 Transcript_334/m.875 type:complete len:544 (+) Transcript_334:86-1717(+)
MAAGHVHARVGVVLFALASTLRVASVSKAQELSAGAAADDGNRGSRNMLFPGDEKVAVGNLGPRELKHLTFHFVNDDTANRTASCTIFFLVRAQTPNWSPTKKDRVKMYLSMKGPPDHGRFQRRGTIKLAKKESTGIARISPDVSQETIFVALAGPNTTSSINVKYILKTRASCSPPLEEAIEVQSENPISVPLTGRYPSALLKLPNARSPSLSLQVMGKHNVKVGADFAIDDIPVIWARRSEILGPAQNWRPYTLSCTPADTYVLVFLQDQLEWQRKTSSDGGEGEQMSVQVTASWDHSNILLEPKETTIKKICNENITLVYRPPEQREWLIWLKAVPQSSMQAMTDLVSLIQQGDIHDELGGAFLNHETCALQTNHSSAVLLSQLHSSAGGILSPPSHLGYLPGDWLLSIQSVPGTCVSMAISAFEADSEDRLTEEFKPGQKLEAVDFLGHHCVATVEKVDPRFQRIYIHFDGWEGNWDFWTSPDSASVAPIGTTEALGLPLDPPRGYLEGAKENFHWDTYLKETNSEAVPVTAFKQTMFF